VQNDDMYKIDGIMVLHSGHIATHSDDVIQCSKEAAFVLDSFFVRAWKDSGEAWATIRIVSAH